MRRHTPGISRTSCSYFLLWCSISCQIRLVCMIASSNQESVLQDQTLEKKWDNVARDQKNWMKKNHQLSWSLSSFALTMSIIFIASLSPALTTNMSSAQSIQSINQTRPKIQKSQTLACLTVKFILMFLPPLTTVVSTAHEIK